MKPKIPYETMQAERNRVGTTILTLICLLHTASIVFRAYFFVRDQGSPWDGLYSLEPATLSYIASLVAVSWKLLMILICLISSTYAKFILMPVLTVLADLLNVGSLGIFFRAHIDTTNPQSLRNWVLESMIVEGYQGVTLTFAAILACGMSLAQRSIRCKLSKWFCAFTYFEDDAHEDDDNDNVALDFAPRYRNAYDYRSPSRRPEYSRSRRSYRKDYYQ